MMTDQDVEIADMNETAEEDFDPSSLLYSVPMPEGCPGDKNLDDAWRSAWMPTDLAGAEWVLKTIADRRARAARIRANGELMARTEEREAAWLEMRFSGGLIAIAQKELAELNKHGGKRRSIRLFNGVMGFRTKPASVIVTNETAAVEWAKENLPAALALRMDKKALSGALTSTGEALPFAQYQPASEQFYTK